MDTVSSSLTISPKLQRLTTPLLLLILLSSIQPGFGARKSETQFAAGFNRRNRSLKGAQAIWTAELPSASQCLSACLRLGCHSLTYGNGRCELFPTYLCHPEDRFRLSLEPASGVTYFDLGTKIPQIKTLWNKEACLLYGRCLEKCSDGAWTTTTKLSPAELDESTSTSIPTTGIALPDASSMPSGDSDKASPDKILFKDTSKVTLKDTPKDIPKVAQKDTPEVAHKDTPKVAHKDMPKVAHKDMPKVAHKDTSKVAHKDTSKVAHKDTSKVAHKDTPKVAHRDTTKNEDLGSGLILVKTPKTFNDSLEYCHQRHLSLAMPETRKDHEVLVEAMKKRKISRMWIGVKKLSEGGKDATYIDGRSVADTLLLWGEGQPNSSRGKQICVEMIASLKYLWNDFDCLFKSAFVCR